MGGSRRTNLAKYFVIPQRYILGLMGFLAIVNAYTMRVSLSIAITEMVAPTTHNGTDNPEACPADDDSSTSTSTITDPDKLYDWSEATQGLILSSFYWGYAITHLPGGILAEKFGGKYTLGLGILSTALFTLITPVVIHSTNGDAKVLIALRVIEGLGEGTTYPALNALLAKWIPLSERAKIGSLVYAGGQIGTIVSNLISGVLIKNTNEWDSVFYLFGGLGVVWVVLWMLLCYSDPESHPFISEEELDYLRSELNGSVSKEKINTPWRAILTSVPVWALVAAQIGHDWGFYTMVTDLPKYMKDVLKYNVEENGLWSSIPYLVMWIVSMISGWLCDFLISKKYVGVTFARKFFTAIAALGPAVFIIVASYTGCDRDLAVIMLTIGMGFMGTYYCGMRVNALDISPNFAGTLMAITNGIGAFAGIITPYLAGALTKNSTLLEWRTVFWISFGVFVSTSIIYVFFGSAEEQWWNNPTQNKEKVEEGVIEKEKKKEEDFRY